MRLPCRYGIANEFTNVKGFLCCDSFNSFTEDSLSLSCKVNRKSSTKQQVMLCPSLSVSKCSSPWSMSNAAKQFDRDLGRALCNYQSPDITSTYSATSTQRSWDFSILSFPGPNLFKILSRRSSKSQRRARTNVAFTQVRLEQQGRRDGAHRGRQHLQRHLRRFDSKSLRHRGHQVTPTRSEGETVWFQLCGSRMAEKRFLPHITIRNSISSCS